ncbi:SRPBCC family protein [Thermogemmatispora sp.]|uniref:SRPBCC family protein n=1 Tax=Thermogemmatispora sp. TaxID=1968838 RepID=UPI001E1A2EDB|nr:SRPBCC family protein [Thermogemmatispora sp.]MBX5450683.1 SRPBCC family protein [Thermogemmatispora sp.]
MSRIIVQSEKVIPAKPEDIYAILADYKGRHPQILPANFQDYRVEQGARGEGTVISFRLRAGGRERLYRMRVSEPVRGQTLTESDLNSSLVTTWTVTPLPDGQHSQVRIATMWEGGSGLGGFFERVFAPLGLRRIYSQTLASLAALVEGRPPEERRPSSPLLLLPLLALIIALPLILRLLQQRRRHGTSPARIVPASTLREARSRVREVRKQAEQAWPRLRSLRA